MQSSMWDTLLVEITMEVTVIDANLFAVLARLKSMTTLSRACGNGRQLIWA